MYGLHWSCVARPTSVQDVIASNMAIQGRGFGRMSVKLRVVASAIFKTAVVICLFNCLIAFDVLFHDL